MSEDNRKDEIYYEQLVAGWVKTRLDSLKAKLISPVVLLFIIGLIQFSNIIKLSFSWWLLAISAFLFLICTITTPVIFYKNADIISDINNNIESKFNNNLVKWLTNVSHYCFFVGFLFLFIFLLFD